MLASVRDLLREDSRRNGGTDGKLIGGLGRYENLTPFGVWLCENVDELADETSGSTEWGEWFARIGKWIVSTDSQGFWYAWKYTTEIEAIGTYKITDEEYGEWASSEDDE